MASAKQSDLSGYHYNDDSAPAHTASYLMPPVLAELQNRQWEFERKSIFEVGCGNGAVAFDLTAKGFEVIGVDPSEQGVQIANKNFPNLKLETGSAYDDLAGKYGQFECVLSLEVVEHVFYPRQYAKAIYDLLKPGGVAIISTPYHGYAKNVLLSLAGKWDSHHSPLWDYGHIKFWSVRTLSQLLEETGLQVLRFHRVGRIPMLAKSMLAVVTKPGRAS